MTPTTEKAIEWLQALAPQPFVGTESRLLTLLQLLRDLATGAQDDPTARIRELSRRRDEIEREIERVREGLAGPLDMTQVKERYAQIADTARRLLADFRQVEENFRMLDGETRERIATALAHPGPVVIDAVVNRAELAMPPSITLEIAKGFTLYMVRAIMNGRGDELVDLATTNFWR